ncbi:Zinc finger RING-CH-type [Penicillium capsulatum]|nr:Zinc finger RING-CH-type [Penicillium capsulatum]
MQSTGPELPTPEPGAQQSYPPACLSHLPGNEFLQKPRVVYVSEDPELGRLLRPCKCKGSSRYVHEGCLQTWRHADPRYGRRNFWQCPTCGFQYRLERLTWARWISSAGTQILLTIGILLFTVFLLGFVADPIIDFYIGSLDVDLDMNEEETSWLEHFVKGMAALGFASFFRAIFSLHPFLSFRSAGVVTPGRSTGRNRAASISWLLIVLGVASFLWVCREAFYAMLTVLMITQAVYKGVRSWSKRTLERAGEKVMDVHLPDDDSDLPEPPPPEPSDHSKTE